MRQNVGNVSPMSNEGRTAYVIEHLTDAMLNLLAEKPINDISISELVDKAQVGRASFYRNYTCKEDILKIYLDSLFKELQSEWNKESNAPLSEQLKKLILHFENNRSFYELLNNRGLAYLLKETILGIFELNPECEMAEAYIKAFAAYTLYGWVDVWFQRGMKESAEEIAELFKKCGL